MKYLRAATKSPSFEGFFPFTLKKQPDRSKSPYLFQIFQITIEVSSVPDITFSFDATMKYLHVITESPLLQGFSTFTFKQQPAHSLHRSSQIDTMYSEQVNTLQKFTCL
jgi:hypothetical protein